MISVTEASKELGITSARIRMLISKKALCACKIGNQWCIDEASVQQYKHKKRKAGRPKSRNMPLDCIDNQASNRKTDTINERIQEKQSNNQYQKMHALFLECRETFNALPLPQELQAAQFRAEADFYMHVSSFFLKEKQKELVKKGVF